MVFIVLFDDFRLSLLNIFVCLCARLSDRLLLLVLLLFLDSSFLRNPFRFVFVISSTHVRFPIVFRSIVFEFVLLFYVNNMHGVGCTEDIEE